MMTVLLAINSDGEYIDLPTPAMDGYSSVPEELSVSNRNTAGNMFKFRINVKQNISAEWHAITPAQKNLILKLTSGNSFQVRFFDTATSEIAYGRFYRGTGLTISPLIRFNGVDFERYSIKMDMVQL